MRGAVMGAASALEFEPGVIFVSASSPTAKVVERSWSAAAAAFDEVDCSGAAAGESAKISTVVAPLVRKS